MNILDIFLVIIILGSLGFIIFLIIRKFPQLVHVDVTKIPGAKDEEVKQKILEEKLKRDVSKNMTSLLDFFGLKKFRLGDLFNKWQDRLSQIERDLQKMVHKDLSSEVKKSKALEDLLENARLYINEEQYSKAEDVLIDALNINDHSVEAYLLLAQIYQGRKELDHARETLEYLLSLTHNDDPKVFHSLAEISMARGNLKEAEEEYLRSISLDENNYLYYLQLADVYRTMDENTKAQEVAKKSLVLAPNNPKVLDFLVEISIILRDKEQASQYLDRLKEVNPDNKKIDSLREKIEAL